MAADIYMAKNISFQNALIDPSSEFHHPHDILAVNDFTSAQKLELLKRWEQDARELAVAEEEGMVGNDKSLLSDIMQAIDELDPGYHQARSSPDKQGNIV